MRCYVNVFKSSTCRSLGSRACSSLKWYVVHIPHVSSLLRTPSFNILFVCCHLQQQNLSTLHPTHDFIQLGANRSERRTTLEAMKNHKLRNARRFITAWSREFDTRSAFSQEDRFESADGGFSVVRFDNAPLPGTSVKAAFDAIIYAMQNVDIIISELFGSITIRVRHLPDSSRVVDLTWSNSRVQLGRFLRVCRQC